MTADEGRKIEGLFGCLTGRDRKANYPHTVYGTVVKVDSRWLMFETTGDVLLLFSLQKINSFEEVEKPAEIVDMKDILI